MTAALYSLRLTGSSDQKLVAVREFIIYGSDTHAVASYAEAIRIRNVKEKTTATMEGPFYLESKIYTETESLEITNWVNLRQEVEDKRKRKPHGLGSCIFRGMWTEEAKKDWKENKDDYRESISFFIAEHRKQYYGEEFYFVGTMYDEKNKKLIGNAVIIKANNLEHAADICQLLYFEQGPVSVFTEWCCPILPANEIKTRNKLLNQTRNNPGLVFI